MPALVLFGRRWLIAGDDVPAPASCIALFHLVRHGFEFYLFIERMFAKTPGLTPKSPIL